jgi:glutamate synthase (ferredoxin)
VSLQKLDEGDVQEVLELLKRHAFYTHSARGWKIRANWDEYAPRFVKVMPKDYLRVVDALKQAEARGLVGEAALMAAFEANKNDASRVSGN